MIFDVQVARDGSTETVSVVGDVDQATLPRLAAALDGADSEALVVDLGSVDWFDPVCLGVLLAADLRCRRSGGGLVIRADGPVAGLLSETRLDTVLEVQT